MEKHRFPIRKDDSKKNPTISVNVLYAKKEGGKYVVPTFQNATKSVKYNCLTGFKQKGMAFFTVNKLFALKHNKDFYCLNCFHSNKKCVKLKIFLVL